VQRDQRQVRLPFQSRSRAGGITEADGLEVLDLYQEIAIIGTIDEEIALVFLVNYDFYDELLGRRRDWVKEAQQRGDEGQRKE